MKLLIPLLILALAGLLHAADEPAPADATSKEIRELLQKGLFEEEANRDLTKAAEAYSSLVGKYDQQRAWAATALFRLAEVRAKQGDKAAAITLNQRLLAEFPTNDPLAKFSRDRLAALGVAAPALDQVAGETITEEEAKELVRVREMAKNSPDLLNAVNKDTLTTPLGDAAFNGFIKVATFMLDHGADVEGGPSGIRPLLLAAQRGNKRMVELLLERKAAINLQREKDGGTALQAACEMGHTEVVRVLLGWGADPNIAGTTRAMAQGGALAAACKVGSVEIARMLLEQGAKPNGLGNGDPPLHRAIQTRNQDAAVPLAKMLIEKGADVNLADGGGYFPLHYAAQRGATPIIALLLEHGAEVNVTNNDGRTPLHMSIHEVVSVKSAVSPQRSERLVSEAVAVWDALAKRPLTVNVADEEGLTPLHRAMGSSLPAEKVLWLVDRGGNLEATDREGRTPLDFTSGERRLFFEKRFVIPKLTAQRTVSALIRMSNAEGSQVTITQPNGTSGPAETSPIQISPVADFEAPPSIEELLRGPFAEVLVKVAGGQKQTELVIYRAGTDASVREAVRLPLVMGLETNTVALGGVSDRGVWPRIEWGDVVVLQRPPSVEAVLPGGLTEPVFALRCLPPAERRVTINLGDRNRSIVIREADVTALFTLGETERLKSGSQPTRLRVTGTPVFNPLVLMTKGHFSEIVRRAVAGEPRADVSAVKVQRTVGGKLQEWTVDLRGENGAVKEMPARMSDGDRIVIPLRPQDDAEALAKRRKGIFQAAPGRVFGAQIFTWREKDHAPRTLGEFLVESYRASEMVIPDPDLSRIIIHRLNGETGEEEHLPMDFAKVISTGAEVAEPDEARKLDVPLEWGDIVEIPARDVPASNWTGFGSKTVEFLSRALSRTPFVQIGRNSARTSWGPDFARFEAGGTRRLSGIGSDIPIFSLAKCGQGVGSGEIARYRLKRGDEVIEFTPEEVHALHPMVKDGDMVEIERR